ncbi:MULTISPECIES: hypothetical protein [Microbacterium]|uniref:hypothetical protein n=1 Tax=Microbacterium TaxID=33882 RepID=UPI002783950C|nr:MULTISPECIES: hypothetical protein [Microbacterium]MDQ1082096.1 hypothetical protein [Microbacterium sp. SORGH_AS_0344]MDQ1169137.1 hypothetical protein [Microbacterium proteolyticum]
MKFSKGFAARIAVATVGGLVLIGTAGAASAAEQVGGEDVDVNVDIADTGAESLSLTIAGTKATLAETASGVADVRQFDGTLPTVTVTDTRDVADIPANTWWYVTGQASDFVGPDGAIITADHFGWTPQAVDDGDTGLIAVGDEVGTSLDSGPNAVGLVGQELLYASLESATVRESGETSWTADAALVLKTDAGVTPGAYTSKLTLSLFEDVF